MFEQYHSEYLAQLRDLAKSGVDQVDELYEYARAANDEIIRLAAENEALKLTKVREITLEERRIWYGVKCDECALSRINGKLMDSCPDQLCLGSNNLFVLIQGGKRTVALKLGELNEPAESYI